MVGAPPILSARGLTVSFGPLRALDGVDLDVGTGEIVALAGENGAGKSTLVRCLSGDLRPDAGTVCLAGQRVEGDAAAGRRHGLSVVWQDLALCDNLDIASNLLLGRETRTSLMWGTRFYARAAALLADLGLALPPLTTPVGHLSGGLRQLVAVARAMRDRPAVLVLDEPTAALGVAEGAQVEELVSSLPAQGTTVLLVTHDVDQMFRLSERIVVLRRGRVAADIQPASSHPDEVAGILSGQAPDDSARSQLNRLHSLADQLAAAEPSSSLSLILSAMAAALRGAPVCVHEASGNRLVLVGALGLPSDLARAWDTIPTGPAGGQIADALSSGAETVTADVTRDPRWFRYRREAIGAGFRSSWSVPLPGARRPGVLTVLSSDPGTPPRDDLALANVYAGYAASALERDRLHSELTSRNRTLETIREVLETLAGPAAIDKGLTAALETLRAGLGAEQVALLAGAGVQAWAGDEPPSDSIIDEVRAAVAAGDGPMHLLPTSVALEVDAPGGAVALLVVGAPGSDLSLLDDAAHSLRLALEREASEVAQREAMALRSSQELQRQFLTWLSHELRTPLTAIRGYASSLMQSDVSWDGRSQQRFLATIADESARLGRLVDDLLDFSAIDAGILRLHPDWCDLSLVLEAARACFPAHLSEHVWIETEPSVPTIWADHDRLEQLLVNLLDNALRHNPPGTSVAVVASPLGEGMVRLTVTDDGTGIPADVPAPAAGRRPERRGRAGGAGLGLSIAHGIVSAHGGTLVIERPSSGTHCVVTLPVALGAPADA